MTTSPELARIFFIIGRPGSGKGLHCSILVENYNLIHICAGDLLREERINPASSDGMLIESHIREGKIVPVSITVKLLWQEMEKKMREGFHHFLVDGFPRNQDNLEGWYAQIPQSKARVVGVLFLDCPEEIVLARVLKRGETSGRVDDNIESTRKRFQTFASETLPVVEHFAARHMCWKVDSSRSISIVKVDVKYVVDTFVFPLKRVVLLVLVSAKTATLALLVREKLLEEFDVVVDDWKTSARNILVTSPPAHGKLCGVLNFGAEETDVSTYRQQTQVLDVDMDGAVNDILARVRTVVLPLFLPPLLFPLPTEPKMSICCRFFS